MSQQSESVSRPPSSAFDCSLMFSGGDVDDVSNTSFANQTANETGNNTTSFYRIDPLSSTINPCINPFSTSAAKNDDDSSADNMSSIESRHSVSISTSDKENVIPPQRNQNHVEIIHSSLGFKKPTASSTAHRILNCGGASSLVNSISPQHRTKTTPMRANPFDSFHHPEALSQNTTSPSLFNSFYSSASKNKHFDENHVSNSECLWTLDQKANLFPAQISEDSPWKQVEAYSVLDPEIESRTQEAIDSFFASQTADVSSKGVLFTPTPPSSTNVYRNTSVVEELNQNSPSSSFSKMRTINNDLCGGSPILAQSRNIIATTTTTKLDTPRNKTKSTQTEMHMPVDFPQHLIDEVLIKYSHLYCNTISLDEKEEFHSSPTKNGTLSENNENNRESMDVSLKSTYSSNGSFLRRKLFEDDDKSGDSSRSDCDSDSSNSPPVSPILSSVLTAAANRRAHDGYHHDASAADQSYVSPNLYTVSTANQRANDGYYHDPTSADPSSPPFSKNFERMCDTTPKNDDRLNGNDASCFARVNANWSSSPILRNNS